MKIIGMTRCRNEARWLKRVIESWMPLCDRLYLLDDRSEDDSAAIAESIPRVIVWPMPDELATTKSEAAHKNWLMNLVLRTQRPDWIFHCDCDEILTPGSIPLIRANLNTAAKCMSFHVRYLWDREDQVRVDGVYGQFARQSMFRPEVGARFEGKPPGFHCGSVPMSMWNSCCYPGVELLHLGYLHREDRLRKFAWYNHEDPENYNEGLYRHMIQGDVREVPADAVLKHSGPLRLEPLHALQDS